MTKFAIILLLLATDSRPPGAIPHTVRVDALTRGQREGSSVVPAHVGSTIRVPRGSAVEIDGHIDSKEWDDAATVNIKVGRDWKSVVRIKHDDLFLYFLFDGL